MDKKKVLHLFYQSLPDISGASVRNHCIMRAQQQSGLFDPIAITPPFQRGGEDGLLYDTIDNVEYYRTWSNAYDELGVGKSRVKHRKLLKLFSMMRFAVSVFKLAKSKNVDVIHAHSTAYTGFVGLVVSFVLGVRFVYEIRANWYEDLEVRHPTWVVAIIKFGESFLCKKADSLVVICNGLAEQYGKLNANVVIVPNGVMEVEESPQQLRSPPTFGFIGSIIPLENLIQVVDALRIVRDRFGYEPRLLIYGAGSETQAIADRANELKLKNVEIKGRMPFSSINKAYSEIDVIVNYRRKEVLADKTTPLKPIEAMALGKLVICSDVSGMLEVTGGRDNVVAVPANSPTQLAEAIANIYRNMTDHLLVANRGREFVTNYRLWMRNVSLYKHCYYSV